MNNLFLVVQIIDGVLDRLHAVAPPKKSAHDGPRQWLYLAEPKISHEIELARLATVLSDPVFPPVEDLVKGMYQLSDGSETPIPPPAKLMTGAPLPRAKGDQIAYSVDFHLIQIFSGLRAYLLVLIDSSHLCARDSDYVGKLPLDDVKPVITEMASWREENFVSNAKYWKDWPLARFLRNPLPPKPSSWTKGFVSPLFGGETARYVNRLANYPSDREDSFHYYRAVFGIAQSKRGFAEVPRSFVRKAMATHASQLSSPPLSSPDMDDLRIFLKTFFQGFRIPKITQSLNGIEGSYKASVENSRENGGARAFLKRIIAEENFTSPTDDETLIRMIEPGGGQPVISERGQTQLSPEEWRSLAKRWTSARSRSFLPQSAQDSLTMLFVSKPQAEPLPIARVAEVLEPLKVRLITAMDAVRTHYARPLQRALWRWLRLFSVFRLVGEPINESMIYDLVERHRAAGGGEDPFVSGDYSAATDGLDIRATKAVLDELREHLDPEDLGEWDFISSIVKEQNLIYPKWAKIAPVTQQNGQLMGSVLSFPILCILNLFAYIKSLPNSSDIIRSRRLMERLAVLINGDDILFRSSESHYEKWLVEISHVGFKPSVGKNFRHPRFFTVNSVPIQYLPPVSPQQFWKDWSWADMEEAPIPWEIGQTPSVSIMGFLNVGLLTGQSKLTGRESLGALPLSGWHAGAVLHALNPAQAHRWFLKYHRAEIQQQTRFGSTTLNIFAHPLLGGLGFQVPDGVEPRFSPDQRRIAHALYMSAMYSYSGQESEYSLDPLVFLESDVSMPLSSLGRKNRRVEVELYPIGTPLPEGYTPFKDETGISPLPMVHRTFDPEDDVKGLKARCRLSSTRIRKLVRKFGTETLALHPLDKMTEFPFTPVRVSRSTFIKRGDDGTNSALVSEERFFSKVYSMEVPFQDVSTPLPDCEVVIPQTVPEDWEDQDVRLVLTHNSQSSVPTSEPKSLSQKSLEARRDKVLQKERIYQNNGMIYQRTKVEQSYF